MTTYVKQRPVEGKERIKSDDLEKVYGATKKDHILCFEGYADSNSAKYRKEDLRRLDIAGDMTFTARWIKPIIVRLLGISPINASSVYSLDIEPGYGVLDDDIYDAVRKNYPNDAEKFLSEYKLVRVEYADSSTIVTNKGNSKLYSFGDALNSNTDLQLFWEKNDTSGGGGGSSSRGGGVSNPKTGDLGIAPYVGILTISVLGTASVVKLLKKEK